MQKPRYYLDASVWGGFFDEEFEEGSKWLFNMINDGEVVCLCSRIVRVELLGAPENVRSFFASASECLEELDIVPEVTVLANTYIREGVIGKTSHDDCLHIALSTVYGADVLFSWNFKHIINEERIIGYNDINVRFGYTALDIRKPGEERVL